MRGETLRLGFTRDSLVKRVRPSSCLGESQLSRRVAVTPRRACAPIPVVSPVAVTRRRRCAAALGDALAAPAWCRTPPWVSSCARRSQGVGDVLASPGLPRVDCCCINLYARATPLSAQIAEWHMHKDLCNNCRRPSPPRAAPAQRRLGAEGPGRRPAALRPRLGAARARSWSRRSS